jgi:hypothetical protein
MQLALADRSADLPEGEERDQCDSKDDPHKKHPARSSAADSGDALANRLSLALARKALDISPLCADAEGAAPVSMVHGLGP